MKAPDLKKFLRALLLVGVLMSLNGCVTGMTVERAKGYGFTEKDGQTVAREPVPALYALTPLTVPVDIALSPIYILWGLGSLAITGRLPY